MRKYILGVIFFLIAGSVISFGQNNWISLKFNHLTTKNGLSNSEISCIVQDRFGYIWFGTMDGLNRYDGYKFKVYKRTSAQPGVLTDNIIKTLHLDKKGRLWIGTSRGISRYNENQDDFTNFIFDTININNGRINKVNAFINDSYGNLITCSEGGTLYQFNDQKQKMEVLKTPDFGIVKYMIADEIDNIFLIGNSGLFCYNLRSGKLQHFYHESPEKPIPSNQLTCLCLNNQKLWIGTVDKGIFIFDTKTSNIQNIETDNPGHQTIQCIKKDINGDIWVGDFAGLRLFPKGGYKSFDYYHAGDDLRSLGGSGINYVYPDRQNNIWLGIGHTGVDFILNYKKFDHYRKESLSPYGLSSEVISSVLSDSKGRLWIGFYNGGINIISKGKTGVIRVTPDNSHGLEMSSVHTIFEDRNNLIWVGTYSGGLYFWNESKLMFENIKHNSKDPKSIPCNDIRSIAEDESGNLWLITHGFGLTKFDRKTKIFTNFRHDYNNNPGNSILDDWSYNIIRTSDGMFWIGGPSGVSVLDPKTMIFRTFQYDLHNPLSLPKGYVNYIFEDFKKQIWIATDYGFCLFHPSDATFINYSEKGGISNNKFCGIQEDFNENLWISSNIGLIKYNPINNKSKIYDEDDGVQSREFSAGACSKSFQGELFFGGTEGLTGFYPNQIKDYTYIPTILITDFKLFNESMIDPIKITANQQKIRKDFLVNKKVELRYNQNVITLEFVALNYLNPQKNKYSYKLEGFEENWNIVINKREITYTNLDPGKYVFKVKVCNSDGYCNETGDSLVITIIPPFWKQIWFRIFALLSIGSLIFLFLYIREQRIISTKKLLEQTVDERTQELLNANEEILQQHDELARHRDHLEEMVQKRTNELEIAKLKAEESDRLKSSFLANMSHEIRTPMNAITGFIYLLNDNELDGDLKNNYLKIITRNSDVLLRLIDDILDFSKIEAGELKVSSQLVSISSLLEEINISYMNMIKDRNASSMRNVKFRYKNLLSNCLSANPKIFVLSDKMRLNQIITNLIENAIKFTENGYIELGIEGQLFVDNTGEYLEIYLEDSGIGIPEEELPFIFDRFRKVESDISKIYRGVGLGLAISKRLAYLLGGTLNVKSVQSKGSRFVLTIPYKAAAEEENTGEDFNKVIIHEEPMKTGIAQDKIILIAEDDESNYKLLEIILKKEGYKILWAKDGEEAVTIASDSYVHLILMDIKLPLLNGILAMKKIKEIKPYLPIIAQTAYAMANERSEMLNAGFEGYISKPISYDLLKETIQKFIL